jgi:hypothetical protein
MDSKKLNNIMVGLLAILGIGLFASVYFVNNALSSKSSELVDARATKVAKQTQEEQLVKAKQDIQKYQDLNEIAKSVVPQEKDQAKTVGEIVEIAKQSGIGQLSSIAFPPSTLGTSTKGTSSGSSGSSPKSVKVPKGLTQVTPVAGLPGVYQLQITVSQAATNPVSYQSFLTFLSKLENNRRTALVSSINVQPVPASPNLVSFTLVINKYIKP